MFPNQFFGQSLVSSSRSPNFIPIPMKKLLLFTLLLLGVFMVQAQEITRRAALHAQITELNDSLITALKLPVNAGIMVVSVDAGGTAAALKLSKNDVIVEVNNVPIRSRAELRAAFKTIRSGDPIQVSFYRKTKLKKSEAIAKEAVREQFASYETIYDACSFGDGSIRMIINKPKGTGPFPTIFFIPGYSCYSLDNIGQHPYGLIAQLLAEAGFVVIRTEKLGEGDNFNTPDCRAVGFYTEVDGFEAGLIKTKTLAYVDQANLYIFGHSLGAMQAPLLASRQSVKGVIVEGTSGDSWFEYILAMFRFQNPITGMDYAENEDLIQTATPLLYEYLVLKKTPAELAKNEAYKDILVNLMQYDGGDLIWDRHYSYWQELQDFNQPEAWKKADTYALILRGSGDFEAFSTEQHQAIANLINFYHPGKADFLLLPNTDHAFCKSNTPEDSYLNGQVPGYHYTQFNPLIIQTIKDWIEMLPSVRR